MSGAHYVSCTKIILDLESNNNLNVDLDLDLDLDLNLDSTSLKVVAYLYDEVRSRWKASLDLDLYHNSWITRNIIN